LNNGQANPLVLGLLLATSAAAANDRWSLAGATVVLAAFIKVYPLALGLLLVAAFPRRFLGWLLTWLLIALLVPFVLQRPDYVLAQYRDWVRYLHFDDRSAWHPLDSYRDIRLVLTVWVARPSTALYLVLQLAAAIGCAGLCVYLRLSDWPRRRLLTLQFGLATGWMTLFGPSTESCTYMLLAPSLAGLLAEVLAERRSALVHFCLWSSMALFAVVVVGGWIPRGVANQIHALGFHPFAGMMLVAGLLANEHSWHVHSRSADSAPALLASSRAA
jgi:hypothetical protein